MLRDIRKTLEDQSVTGRLFATLQVQAPFGATSGALDANDALGDIMEFDVPRRGRILSIKRIDLDDDTLADTIHIYNERFVAAASDAAYTVAVGDGLKWVTTQTFPTGVDEGGFKVAEITDINSDYVAPSGKLYAQLSSTGTPNIANAGVMPVVQIFILPLS